MPNKALAISELERIRTSQLLVPQARYMGARLTADGRQMDGTGDEGYMGLLDKT